MKVILLAENLQRILTIANKAISTRNQLPILSHILLEAKGEQIVVSSTDLEIGIETACIGQIEEEGAIAIPARLFLEISNVLPQEKITLEANNSTLSIVSTKTKTLLQTSSKEEFPLLYEKKGEAVAEFSKGSMKEIFGKILFAASTETTRPALSGILLQKNTATNASQDKFVIVATDGYRLSFDELESQGKESFSSLLIPVRILREAIGIFDEEKTTLFLSKENNQIIFEQGDTVLIGRVIDATFPNYEKVIPTDQASTITFDKEALLRAVKTCAIFAREAANIITFSLTKNSIVVSAKSPSLGENTVDVEATLLGEENQIAFNARYLLETLTNINAQDITFSMTGPLNPGVIRIVGNNHFLHLIMPIRT